MGRMGKKFEFNESPVNLCVFRSENHSKLRGAALPAGVNWANFARERAKLLKSIITRRILMLEQ